MKEPVPVSLDATPSAGTPSGGRWSRTKQLLAEHFDKLATGQIAWKRNRYYHRELARFIKFVVPGKSRVLEIGCGDYRRLVPDNDGRLGFDHKRRLRSDLGPGHGRRALGNRGWKGDDSGARH